MPRKGTRKDWGFLDPFDPEGLVVLMRAFLEHRTERGYAERSVKGCEESLSRFIVFCQERSLMKARDVTKPILDRYQRALFLSRKSDGEPLSFSFQQWQLCYLKTFFRWLVRQNHLLSNPASEIELPRVPHRLPGDVFSEEEAEKVLAQPDVSTPMGLRDRTILETFYSTGIRRKELTQLKLHDVNSGRGTLRIREGKGKKERIVPIGERALHFLSRYRVEARPSLVREPDEGFLFLTYAGVPFNPDVLTGQVRAFIEKAGVKKKGSCHLFRHTAATLMLEGGADVRYVQEMLGHAHMNTTEIYTRVAITKLKAVHAATHPGAMLKRGPGPKTEAAQQDQAPEPHEPESGPLDQEDGAGRIEAESAEDDFRKS
jgi:integrase/recombinase XerD